MVMPLWKPDRLVAIAQDGDSPMEQTWEQFVDELLLEAHRAFVPPKGIVAAYFTGSELTDEFDGTGLGRNGGPFQWWAICNGNNNTPDLAARAASIGVTAFLMRTT